MAIQFKVNNHLFEIDGTALQQKSVSIAKEYVEKAFDEMGMEGKLVKGALKGIIATIYRKIDHQPDPNANLIDDCIELLGNLLFHTLEQRTITVEAREVTPTEPDEAESKAEAKAE